MWKYIITWCVVTLVQDPCPDANTSDEFGRIGNSYISCTVFHSHYERDCSHSKVFINRDSAFLFYKKAKKLEPRFTSDTFKLFNNGDLDKVNIDSIKI